MAPLEERGEVFYIHQKQKRGWRIGGKITIKKSSTTNSTWTVLRLNSELQGKNLASNCLSY
jgi:hypothetical protein